MAKIALWIPDQVLRIQINTILSGAGYLTTLIEEQSFTNDNMENWDALILHTDILQQNNDIASLLDRVHHVSKCKVLILSEREFYPLIGKNEWGIDQWVDWVLYFPIDKDELVINVRRYLGDIL
jgi:hypothetical protein